MEVQLYAYLKSIRGTAECLDSSSGSKINEEISLGSRWIAYWAASFEAVKKTKICALAGNQAPVYTSFSP
jgi:hypothetical protein